MKKAVNTNLPKAVRDFFSRNGAKAGSVRSERKAIAARKNGCAPCHPGKRRGRPRKNPIQN